MRRVFVAIKSYYRDARGNQGTFPMEKDPPKAKASYHMFLLSRLTTFEFEETCTTEILVETSEVNLMAIR